MSTKQTLNIHLQKSNDFFQTKSFEQLCVLLHALLNQGYVAYHCSLIGMKDAGFNQLCLSNAKR